MSRPLPVRFTVSASKQLHDAQRWWCDHRTRAPDALTEELEQVLQLIASQPDVGARARNTKLAGVRRVLLSRVSYHLYYRRVEVPSPSIQVVAMWHASRGAGPAL